MEENKKPVGSYTFCNTGYALVYIIDDINDYVGYAPLTSGTLSYIAPGHVGIESYDAAFEGHGQDVFSGLEGLL